MEYFYACIARNKQEIRWMGYLGKGLKFNLLFALNSNIVVSCLLHSPRKLRINGEGNR